MIYIQAMPIKRNEIYLLKLLVKRIFSITLSSIIFNTKNAMAMLPKISESQWAPITTLDNETDNARVSIIETITSEYLVLIFLVASDIQANEILRIVAA